MFRATLVILLLAGCPHEAAETEPVVEEFDFLAGEGETWKWGVANCVTYMRESAGSRAKAWWMNYGTLVRHGDLSGVSTSTDSHRGFYVDRGKLAIERSGSFVKRYFYDELDRVVEVVHQKNKDPFERTTYEYDAANRLAGSSTVRRDVVVRIERWEYGTDGALSAYTAADVTYDGREVPTQGWTVTRTNLAPIEVRHFGSSGMRTYTYEYVSGNIVKARVFDGTEKTIAYEWDDKRRLVARTLAPSMLDEKGWRTEVLWDDKAILERRELTANGYLLRRTTFARNENGDVTRVIDANADGEPDQTSDLRDECKRFEVVPELVASFLPYLEVDGMVPFLRPDVGY